MQELSEEDFAAQVEELAKSKLQRPKKLATLANRWLPEIILGRNEWRRHEAIVEELRTLTIADILKFVDTTIMNPTSSRKLCIHVKGAAEMAREVEETQKGGDSSVSPESAMTGVQECTNGSAENGDTRSANGKDEGACDAGIDAIRVESDQVSQFRLSQPLWPLPRHVW
jgi:hypothetical protein